MSQNKNLVSELVTKFNRNFDEYKNPIFNETQVRIEFVNPFWKALGWDVDNINGNTLSYRDVVHEDSLKIGRTTKAPDYSFQISGSRKFFVETKKPAIDLKHNPAPAFQLRRYAYSAKLPISILTDFEEFIIYDCRMKPALLDKPHVGRMLYYTFEEYLDKWNDLSNLLSKEAVMQGELDRFIKSKEGKKPKTEIDRDFLNDLDTWRIQLARNIAIRNPQLNERELNYAVQLTIDRLIFLRMSEDRGIETQFTLQALLGGENVYRRLVQIYYKADERYNSGLFHFEEKDGLNPDTITPELSLDDKILKDIIGALYYPKCPYEFSVLPVEVLGNAYEQFLGKQISLTKGHHARIEEKPEVRKAGGVYYTPKYIVDYIVKNTIGKLCENKSAKEISELRVLDPACGSGSFLLGAFQHLLDWHLEYYKNEFDKTGQIPSSPQPKGNRKQKHQTQVIFQGVGENWYLSTAEKKRILINNIYGVDIDANAVEVTKLSLLLKVLENENSETLNRQLGLWHERALPNLENNIKCGNSLIGPDFYDNQQATLFDEEEMYRVNVFDWYSEYKDIFDKGGFDIVIGNPPYIRIQTTFDKSTGYLNSKYETAIANYDIYCLFMEKGANLLNEKGILGYILPHRFFKTDYGEGLRKFILKNNLLNEIIDFDGYMVFKQASINTSIVLLEKNKNKEFLYLKIDTNKLSEKEIKSIVFKKENNTSLHSFSQGLVDKSKLNKGPWIFIREYEKTLWNKLDSIKSNLGTYTKYIFQGLKTGADSIYIVNALVKNNKTFEIFCPFDKKSYSVENSLLKPLIKGGNMKRYFISQSNKYILFPYQSGMLIEESKLKQDFPLTFEYLSKHKVYLEGREKGKMRSQNWYGYTRNQSLKTMYFPKIITPDYYAKASYCWDKYGDYFFCGGGAGGYGIVTKEEISPQLLLGLLNSKLLDWYLHKISLRAYQTAYMYVKKYIINLPIQNNDNNNQISKAVNQILDLNKKLSQTKDPQSQKQLQRQIDATDKQIDQLVYQLYGLTEEEIRIVEDSIK